DGRKMLAVAAVTEADADIAALRRRVREEGRAVSVLVTMDQLPRNPAGKVMRQSLAGRLAKAVERSIAENRKA
ncbi:hypothetical protein ACT3J6_24555, partial [Mycobacterium tuberculosis]